MKPSILILALLLLIASPLHSEGAIDNAHNLPITHYSGTFSFQAAEPIRLQIEGFSLFADSGSLQHNLAIELSVIPYKGSYTMRSNMENVSANSEL